MTDLRELPWWTAEARGVIYASAPGGRQQVGMMDSPELAEEAADAHNAALAARKGQARASRSGAATMTGLTGVQFGDGCTQYNNL